MIPSAKADGFWMRESSLDAERRAWLLHAV
jgi:hypothetical protein